MYEVVTGFLQGNGWAFQELEPGRLLALGLEGEQGRYQGFLAVDEEGEEVTFSTILPVPCPSESIPAMVELVTRLNFVMPRGNLDLDIDDGDLRFRTYVDVKDDRLSSALVRNVLLGNLVAIEHLMPSLAATARGEITPKEAMARITAGG
jgi:hypothetical protein